jgi:hypothetical protein
MLDLCESPFGFEDGQILSYRAGPDGLFVQFEFWNEERRIFEFKDVLAVADDGAIGLTIARAGSTTESEFLSRIVARHYDKDPAAVQFKNFEFFDLEDFPVFQVIARDCSLTRNESL